jgi:hypothetical protein
MTLHWKNTANFKSTALMASTDCLEWVNNHHHLLIVRTDMTVQHTVHTAYDMYNLVLTTFGYRINLTKVASCMKLMCLNHNEDEGNKLFQNVCNSVPCCMASHSRTTKLSQPVL